MFSLNSKSKYYLVLALIGCLFLLLSWNTTPTLSDDMVYGFKFSYNNDYSHPVPIKGLGDAFESALALAYNVNGRVIIQTIAIWFISLVPKHIADVINSFLFICLLDLSLRLLKIKNDKVSFAVIMASLMFVVIVGFQSSFLWNCGSYNYLWVLSFNLLFLQFIGKYGTRRMRWYHWLLAILALPFGWSHEGWSIPLTFGFAVYAIINRKTFFRTLAFPCFVFYAIGAALCVSPGTLARSNMGMSLLSRLIAGGSMIVLSSRMLWLLVIVVAVRWIKKDRQFVIDNIKEYSWLWTAWLVAYGIVLLCGSSNIRVNFFAEFISLLLLVTYIKHYASRALRPTTIITGLLAIVVYIPVLYCCRLQVGDYEYAVKQMEEPGKTVIRTHITRPDGWLMNKIYDAYVVPFASYHFYQCYMGFDAYDSNERCAATKYGKPKMIFLPQKMVDSIEKGTLSSNHFTLFSDDNLYAILLDKNEKVNKVVFNLKPENVDSLHIWQRPLAYKEPTYEIDDFHWQVDTVANRRVLIVTKPLTNVFRRIKNIQID